MTEDQQQQPSYKLIYFNARGRAEHIRFVLAYAGVDYVDERVPKERWPELKKSVPYGQLPVLEVDGQRVAQSNAIARYLARKYGLVGADEWEAMQCDVLVDSLGDLRQELLQFQKEEDLFKREEKKAKFAKETIPFFLNKFEQTVGKNNGYAVGSSTTWADFVFAVALENFEQMFGGGALESYPALRSLKQRVHGIPAIAEWIAKRPHTSS
ncbi:glutathione S-transferase-like [Copidosoma floridanum]|uniref:glutathione S-transferase-like n=1 Tax=Copidosoma floridanum TaxID=29053 RepID=UPI0006C9A366|nr:glutathione S-transferase-like [Copidosoma floridanum]